MSKFRVGDNVLCVSEEFGDVKLHREYTVTDVTGTVVEIGDGYFYGDHRFEAVPKEVEEEKQAIIDAMNVFKKHNLTTCGAGRYQVYKGGAMGKWKNREDILNLLFRNDEKYKELQELKSTLADAQRQVSQLEKELNV